MPLNCSRKPIKRKFGTGSSCVAIGIGDAENLNKDHVAAAVQ